MLRNIARYSYQPTIKFTHGQSITPGKKMTVRDALNLALDEELGNDPNVFLLGEEVGVYQGAYKVSKGLYEKYGADRVLDTPITEAGFTGLAVGAALYGLKPIVEFMTWNFAMQAIDHIVNSSAKMHYMSAGNLSTSIVYRGINGAAAAVGAQHSQCYAAWYSQCPGLIVLAPYDAEDTKALLKAAVRNPNPVVFLENEIMYSESFEVSSEVMNPNYLAPIGKAKVMRQGEHVTIVAFSKMVHYSLQAAELLSKEGISCEVINLRSIRPLDRQAIIDSVKKTTRLVCVEEGWAHCGVMSEVCSLVMETEAYQYLDAPVQRITGLDIPTPYAFNLELLTFPKVEQIVEGVRTVMHGVK